MKKYWMAAVGCLMLAGCTQPVAHRGEGQVAFTCELLDAVGVTRSDTRQLPEGVLPASGDLKLVISGEEGEIASYATMAEYDQPLLKEGDYTAAFTYGDPSAEGAGKGYFAGGCFWGVEYHFRHREGVVSATSGYMGGRTDAPSYPEVCSGSTGHAETVRVVFDPAIVSFEELARLFFEIHDPTQVNRQGPDIGEQYRSEIFYTSEDQRLTADALTDRLTARGYDVATRLTPAGVFWPAEAYHQNHYDLRGTVPYCHLRVKRF